MSLWDAVFGESPQYAAVKPPQIYHQINYSQQSVAEQFDKDCMAKALELRKDCPPDFNILPTLELVKRARLMGLDVCQRPLEAASPQPK